MKIIATEDMFLQSYKLKKFGHIALKNFKFQFPIYSNNNLAKIVSYITFDGHLTLKGNMFYFSSKYPDELTEFESIIKREFKIGGKVVKNPTSIGTCYKYLILNGPATRILHIIGVPQGPKVKTMFSVPIWIKENREFSRDYLRVAFDCEGSMWKEPNRYKIRFRMNKITNLLPNGIKFMKTLKSMLAYFGISTTNIWLTDCNIRKDGYKTHILTFDISTKDINKFKQKIGFKVKNKVNTWG